MHYAEDKGEVLRKGIDLKRFITAAVLLPLIIAYVYYLPPFPYFFILLLIVATVSLREFLIMYNVTIKLYLPALILGGTLFYILCLYPNRIVEALFAVVSILLLIRLVFVPSPSGSMKEMGTIGVGLLYITTFLSFQWFLRDDVMGSQHILLLYGSVWFADSTAYYIGTYLGRNRLYPSISPNKTVEGALGGIVGGALGALIITAIFYNTNYYILLKGLMIGVILGIISVVGDLVESMFKRDAGVKDSGKIIPGHGGLLDKIDGVLLAGPVLYLILRLS